MGLGPVLILVRLGGVPWHDPSCAWVWIKGLQGMTAHFPNSSNARAELAADMADVIEVTPRHGLYRQGLKRVFDVAFVLGISPLILPIVAILALVIFLADGRGPFFLQQRVGRGGRVFWMVKLRSMVPNADRRLVEHLRSNPEARIEWERDQKLRRDPRITRVGRFIRKCSLDELPQFWNVLLGDMSLVGPRPMLTAQRDLYPGQAYYLMRPGVTGLWQIGDRHNTSFAGRARFDAQYYHCIGLLTDIGIILRTIRVVFRGTGC